jgi:hypothetical protein
MPRRRRVRQGLSGLLLALAALLPPPTVTARADEPPEPPAGREEGQPLGNRLAAQLKTRRPEDVAFLEQVERLVRDGKLPAKVVTSTSAWATRRGKARPFPSFRRALEIQADRLGVSFDEEP